MRLVTATLALLLLFGLGPTAALVPVAAADGPNHPSTSSLDGAADAAATSAAVSTTGSAPDSQARQAENQTISGTVTDANGSIVSDATVLVGSRALFEKSSPSELRELAGGSAQDVAVATTDAEGTYSLTVGENVEAEAVVAVSADGVSRVQPFEAGELNLTLRSTKSLTMETTGANTEPGGRATVTFRLKNTDDTAVEGLKVTLGKLPDGWNVASSNSETGTYSTANRTFTWDTIEAGETVEAQVRLFVAIDADTKTYDLPIFATSKTHNVEAGNVSVGVAYPGDGTTETGADQNGDSGVETPGFGPVVAILAVAGAALVLARRSV